jgi:hypothetical protein
LSALNLSSANLELLVVRYEKKRDSTLPLPPFPCLTVTIQLLCFFLLRCTARVWPKLCARAQQEFQHALLYEGKTWWMCTWMLQLIFEGLA